MIVWLDGECSRQRVSSNLGDNRLCGSLHLVIPLRDIYFESEPLILDQDIFVIGLDYKPLQIVILHDESEAIDLDYAARLKLPLGLYAFYAFGFGWPGATSDLVRIGPDFQEVKKPHARFPFLLTA